jgi:diguanylate cyclase (GGDEF)-like protein
MAEDPEEKSWPSVEACQVIRPKNRQSPGACLGRLICGRAARNNGAVVQLRIAEQGIRVTAMLVHAASDHAERLHSQFFLLVAVGLMSLQSAAHLYASAMEHLSTKQDMAKLTKYDPLTGLPNRLLVRGAFQELFSFSRRSQSQLAVLYLDLDAFKAINDRYGHPAGDKLLVEVAQRLLSTVRASDLACRLGGDEFLIIQSDVRHRDQAELSGRRIIRQISEDYNIESATMLVTASMGCHGAGVRHRVGQTDRMR